MRVLAFRKRLKIKAGRKERKMGNQESGMQYWEDQIEHLLPGQIEARSFALIDQELDQMGIHLDETTGPVIRRAIHTTADFDYAKNLVFSPR